MAWWRRRKPQIEVFAEDVCEHCLIFRSGPVARQMWMDFGYAVVGKKNFPKPGHIEWKALVAPRMPRWLHWLFVSFGRDHVDACRELSREMGYEPHFERAKRRKKDDV